MLESLLVLSQCFVVFSDSKNTDTKQKQTKNDNQNYTKGKISAGFDPPMY